MGLGMHKHFRMIAIHDYMISQGVVNPNDAHTSIRGIWEKLGTLYNLPVLDEREDSIMNDLANEDGEIVELYSPFSLPEEEYGAMMFARRLDPNGTNSPDLAPSRRESTIADTDEPGSSPAPGKRSGRSVRTPARGGRVSRLQNEAESSRRTSKAPSVAEDEIMEDAGAEEEAGDSGEDDQETGEDDDTEQSAGLKPKKKPRKSAQNRVGKLQTSARRSARKK